jgi:rod shape-determining protein MreC
LSRFSKTHEAYFSTEANEIIGKINAQYNKFNRFFTLVEANKELAAENAKLRESLKNNFIVSDTSTISVTDTLIKDTSNHYRKYSYLPALVVGNTISLESNFIQLERGSKQGVRKDMGVIGPLGIVGKVVSVSENYSVVMSLLNRNSKVSAMFKKGKEQYATNVSWDGKDANYLTMEKVSKAVDVKKGDTVVTSNYSPSFPSLLMIGTVAEIKTDAMGNNYSIKIKAATNFNTLQHVNIIANHYFEEQFKLDSLTKKQQFNTAGE